ncbi:MAG TPA: hypothetical protein VN377_04615, partial [Candidatus Thermoplasmatota archaeon]|nr:hypothetical protein [Candidatus Thermoplasmatota archaeon]
MVSIFCSIRSDSNDLFRRSSIWFSFHGSKAVVCNDVGRDGEMTSGALGIGEASDFTFGSM